jgi:hypothetical protein
MYKKLSEESRAGGYKEPNATTLVNLYDITGDPLALVSDGNIILEVKKGQRVFAKKLGDDSPGYVSVLIGKDEMWYKSTKEEFIKFD